MIDEAKARADLITILDGMLDAAAAKITVRVENAYECGRESSAEVQVDPPAPGQDLRDWWEDSEVHDHTGDGHPCGASENAIYDVTIIAAPGRPELVGETYGWGG